MLVFTNTLFVVTDVPAPRLAAIARGVQGTAVPMGRFDLTSGASPRRTAMA